MAEKRIGPEGYHPMWDDIPGDGVAHYGMDGQPLSMRQWCEIMEDPKAKRVAETTVADPDGEEYWVSTVLLGLDHQFLPDGPPLIFETMVFKGDASDLDCDRYSTLEQAEIGHRLMCDKVRDGKVGEDPLDAALP